MKKSNAPKPKRIVQRKLHKAPAVNANARHMAESMVKSILNFKSIVSSFLREERKVAHSYNIYNIVHARARDVKKKRLKSGGKMQKRVFYKKIKFFQKISKKFEKMLDKGYIFVVRCTSCRRGSGERKAKTKKLKKI